MARAEGPPFADLMRRRPDLLPAYTNRMAMLQWGVHRHPATTLASLKARLAANIRQATMLGEARQTSLLDRLTTSPDGDRLCHGDFHPFNILGQLGHETIVDWLDASRGEPAADVCRSYVLIKSAAPEIASAYVDAYARVSGESHERILCWLPFAGAARLAEGVPGEADSLIAMAS
jgi:Ser/Thr protein kinase RdoA (MazF antagonist)